MKPNESMHGVAVSPWGKVSARENDAVLVSDNLSNWPINESKSARRRFTFVMERGEYALRGQEEDQPATEKGEAADDQCGTKSIHFASAKTESQPGSRERGKINMAQKRKQVVINSTKARGVKWSPL